jgi:2-phospho-L-lactate guanylyltransferase
VSPDRPTSVVYAIVPVGPLDGGKSRLGDVLDAEERHDLVLGLADATIRAAVATPAIDETIVITPDDTVRALALAAGARPIRQRSRGLNAGLREARVEAIASGATAVLVLPIDLPRVTPAALSAIIATLGDDLGPLVGIVPDQQRRGTNALLVAPPDVIDFQFGGDSRSAHVAAAAAAGARVVELDGPLRQDLDTADDLLATQVEGGSPIGG